MWLNLKNFFQPIIKILFYMLFIASILTLSILILENLHWVNIIDLNKKDDGVIFLTRLNSYAIIILTLIIVCAGWFQFKELNKTTKGDFLLRIDDRFGHETIIKARTIIHKYYCETWKEGICKESHRKIIGKKIKAIMLREDYAEDFTYLLNFLGFLEAISYFTNKNYISETELKELMGGSLPYYYDVYKPFINHRRDEYNQNYYCQLETLVNKINMT